MFWITLCLSSDCRLRSLGARLTLMSEYLLGGSFKLSLVAVCSCRIYFICDGKINNRSSNYWESGVSSSSILDWVPAPPDPWSHWDLWSEQKQWDTGCVASVSDGVVKPLIYLDKWAWWFINIYGKLYIESPTLCSSQNPRCQASPWPWPWSGRPPTYPHPGNTLVTESIREPPSHKVSHVT